MCFSWAWFEWLVIGIIIVCTIVAILRATASFLLPRLGLAGEVVGFLTTILWYIIIAVICIAVVVFAFELIACLVAWVGGLPRLR